MVKTQSTKSETCHQNLCPLSKLTKLKKKNVEINEFILWRVQNCEILNFWQIWKARMLIFVNLSHSKMIKSLFFTFWRVQIWYFYQVCLVNIHFLAKILGWEMSKFIFELILKLQFSQKVKLCQSKSAQNQNLHSSKWSQTKFWSV